MLTITEHDAQLLREALERLRKQIPTGRRQFSEESDPQAPEVYVVLTPHSGIPPMVGSSPGVVTCDIYKIQSGVLTIAGFQKDVHNLSLFTFPANSWAPVLREKWGYWYVVGSPSNQVVPPPDPIELNCVAIQDFCSKIVSYDRYYSDGTVFNSPVPCPQCQSTGTGTSTSTSSPCPQCGLTFCLIIAGASCGLSSIPIKMTRISPCTWWFNIFSGGSFITGYLGFSGASGQLLIAEQLPSGQPIVFAEYSVANWDCTKPATLTKTFSGPSPSNCGASVPVTVLLLPGTCPPVSTGTGSHSCCAYDGPLCLTDHTSALVGGSSFTLTQVQAGVPLHQFFGVIGACTFDQGNLFSVRCTDGIWTLDMEGSGNNIKGPYVASSVDCATMEMTFHGVDMSQCGGTSNDTFTATKGACLATGTGTGGGGGSGNLVGYWPFNEGTGTTAHDHAGVNDMTLNAPSWSVDTPGSQAGTGGCFSIPVGQNAISSTITGLPTTGIVTVTFWYKLGAASSEVQFDYGSLAYIQFQRVVGDNTIFQSSSNGTIIAATSIPDGDGAWHHYALSINGSAWKYYFDGIPFDSGTFSVPTNPTSTSGVAEVSNPAGGMVQTSEMKDLRAYAGVLSDANVASIFAGTFGP